MRQQMCDEPGRLQHARIGSKDGGVGDLVRGNALLLHALAQLPAALGIALLSIGVHDAVEGLPRPGHLLTQV